MYSLQAQNTNPKYSAQKHNIGNVKDKTKIDRENVL